MTRSHVGDGDRRWVMRCDRTGCPTVSEPFDAQPKLELFRDRGWFIGRVHGDRCPACVRAGLLGDAPPHHVMAGATLTLALLHPDIERGTA